MDHTRGDITVPVGANKVANSDWVAVTDLGSWRGNVDGCEMSSDQTKINVGKCSAYSDSTGKNVEALKPVVLSRWRNSKFLCVLKTKGS